MTAYRMFWYQICDVAFTMLSDVAFETIKRRPNWITIATLRLQQSTESI